MTTKIPVVALIAYPVPHLVFGAALPEGHLFDLKDCFARWPAIGCRARNDDSAGRRTGADRYGGILVVPGWDDLNTRPDEALVAALTRAHTRGMHQR
jgi:hypothetical protein